MLPRAFLTKGPFPLHSQFANRMRYFVLKFACKRSQCDFDLFASFDFLRTLACERKSQIRFALACDLRTFACEFQTKDIRDLRFANEVEWALKVESMFLHLPDDRSAKLGVAT